MTRIKPVKYTPEFKTANEVDDALCHIADLRRQRDLIITQLSKDVDDLKKTAAALCTPLDAHIAEYERGISLYAEINKESVFSKRRSLPMTFGTIGYRASTKLKTLRGWTWDRVLCALQDAKLNKFVRTKYEVDKEALKGASPDMQNAYGTRLVQEDVFFYELAEPPLKTEAK